ncbi:PIN domain-containing protein [Candidatus Micrarchaeota archaeon]|nr:PIN domain-containing protein [Candidatus Micrarchaeota archaeon]MBU1930397.1 PIN domain-containing protein [Candidatus Micrarchaeota archaeon]
MNENKPDFLIDTNILVYAQDLTAEPHKRQTAKTFLAKQLFSPKVRISAQNLAEFYSVLTTKLSRQIPREQALEHLNTTMEAFQNILSYSASTVQKAAQINARHQTPFWDSLLAATMLENNIHIIYTENTGDFKKIPHIKAINLFAKQQKK